MTGALAVLAANSALVMFSGSLSGSAASSPVTSDTRSINLAATLLFNNLDGLDATPEYQKNGGAWTTITAAMTLVMAASDTLAVRAQMFEADVTTFHIRDNANSVLIESVVLERT